MSDLNTPAYLQDANALLTSSGFRLDGTWYHGTASGLIEAIDTLGLRGSGDLETLQKHFAALGTLGHEHSTHKDPLFITQSKELAYFWAAAKTHTRNRFNQSNEQPVVFALELSPELQAHISTDAGGAALLLEPNNKYIAWLKELYASAGLTLPELNPFSCDRMDYLNRLGLAYLSQDLAPGLARLLKP